MATARSYPFSKQTVEALSAYKKEPSWMLDIRLRAWAMAEKFLAQKPAALEGLEAFTEPPKISVPMKEWPRDLSHALEERGDEEGLIVQRDSTILSRAISKEQAAHGALFTDLHTAVREMPDLVKKYFGQQAWPDTLAKALNTAFWSGGSFLFVPANVAIHLPFHTCYWVSTPQTGLFPRTIMVAERGAVVSMIDEFLSPTWDSPGHSTGCAEIWVADRARAHYLTIENLAGTIRHAHHEEAQIDVSGKLISFSVSMGANSRREGIAFSLRDASSEGATTSGREFNLPTSAEAEVHAYLESALAHLPTGALREKLRHLVIGQLTGHRPTLTLEKVAELHPEVRL